MDFFPRYGVNQRSKKKIEKVSYLVTVKFMLLHTFRRGMTFPGHFSFLRSLKMLFTGDIYMTLDLLVNTE